MFSPGLLWFPFWLETRRCAIILKAVKPIRTPISLKPRFHASTPPSYQRTVERLWLSTRPKVNHVLTYSVHILRTCHQSVIDIININSNILLLYQANMNTLFYIVASLYLLAPFSEAFTPSADHPAVSKESSSQLYFTDDTVKTDTAQRLTLIKGKKPTIAKLKSLDDLKYFLEEDQRITAIK